jgi:hypothetical protein
MLPAYGMMAARAWSSAPPMAAQSKSSRPCLTMKRHTLTLQATPTKLGQNSQRTCVVEVLCQVQTYAVEQNVVRYRRVNLLSNVKDN